MCGGTLEIMPCSKVGHIFRHRRPYGSPDGEDTMLHNSLRVAYVWMDDYKVSVPFKKSISNIYCFFLDWSYFTPILGKFLQGFQTVPNCQRCACSVLAFVFCVLILLVLNIRQWINKHLAWTKPIKGQSYEHSYLPWKLSIVSWEIL